MKLFKKEFIIDNHSLCFSHGQISPANHFYRDKTARSCIDVRNDHHTSPRRFKIPTAVDAPNFRYYNNEGSERFYAKKG
jgi:hypothetical protein